MCKTVSSIEKWFLSGNVYPQNIPSSGVATTYPQGSISLQQTPTNAGFNPQYPQQGMNQSYFLWNLSSFFRFFFY